MCRGQITHTVPHKTGVIVKEEFNKESIADSIRKWMNRENPSCSALAAGIPKETLEKELVTEPFV